MKLFDRLKLKDKLFLLGVLPAAALTLILAVYFTSTRLSDMHDLIDKTNENLARSIAEASINNVFTGNIDALNLLVKESINESNVLSITITNPMGLELTQATATSASAELIANPPKKITQPIELKSLAQKDEFDNLLVGDSTSSNLPMGYVSIAITYDSLKERQQDILLNSFYITLMLLTGIALIARKTSLAIGRPILQLADDVKKIKQGNYSAPRLFINNNDEITILANSIHEMASEIERHQKELKQKIDLATHELRQQNDKLFTAQGEIIKSAEAKTRFISYISHEIRTPLNGIIGFLEIIQKTNLDNEQKTLANASHLASKNLHVIINEVLDLAQIEADKVVINKSDFRLKQTIQD
ncbi:MAG TPA: HAMP domain-containing protein, partial [Methylococcales bacterium]|nr:HAMP domain-containing protein [Methylococcales bacterium]